MPLRAAVHTSPRGTCAVLDVTIGKSRPRAAMSVQIILCTCRGQAGLGTRVMAQDGALARNGVCRSTRIQYKV